MINFGGGSNYSPGCSSVPGDEPIFCAVCLESDANCVCPECPTCGEYGNPECYGLDWVYMDGPIFGRKFHGMATTDQQRATVAKITKEMAEEFFNRFKG